MSDTVESAYMQALYDLAADEENVESVYEQLTQINQIFSDNPDYLRLLQAPVVADAQKRALVDEAFGGRVDAHLLNFLKVLCDNRRIGAFAGIAEAFEARYNAEHNILKVTAVTAVPLDARLQEKLTKRLEQVSGKTVRLVNRVRDDLLGGILLQVGGKTLDASVRARLDALQQQLRTTIANPTA